MQRLRSRTLSLLIASLLVVLTFGAWQTATAATTYTDQTNVTFTSSAGVSSKYHVYAAGITAPAGLLLQFHGDGAYEFKNPTSSYSLGGSKGIVAQARARNLITVPVLAPDTSGDITWWESGSRNADYVRELLLDLESRYNVRTDRIWLVGYSGGAQFITQFFLPKYSSLVAGGGGAVIIGGGGKPQVTAQPVAASVLSNFPMHWYTGASDTRDEDGWNALADAKAGESWYAGKGFKTTHEWPAGVTHNLDGQFGTIVARQLDAHPASGTGPTSTPTSPTTTTASPTTSPTTTTPTKPPTTSPTSPTVTPTTSPTGSGWVTAVTPNRTGVAVTVNIPASASGRTTLTVYGTGGNYWYEYTTSKRRVVTLSIDGELRAGRAYTFEVTNNGAVVGSGSFSTPS